ncbi:uncharacterized protein PG986_004263 [Apiospora aurea]|uniref:Transmembrane protein n=1 Tax=Apiospora aurea TaxID=335848 RepID=A0ABR1QNN0_9PEZI
MALYNQTSKGFLVPEWFEEQEVIPSTMNTASVFLGLSLGSAIFAAAKAMQQTSRMWKRHRTITTYAIMIWLHWAASIALGFINWFYMWGTIVPSFWLFLGILIVWVAQVLTIDMQTQLLVQIIINRLSLLMMVRWDATKLKWGTAALMTAINVSVFIIWIPARLQISQSFINGMQAPLSSTTTLLLLNRIWDPIEKCLFLLIDLSLNICFIRLVKDRLIANGLTKYDKLLSGNLALVVINISLDVIFIGLMWLPNTSVYLNFQSFAYLCKLYIEMTMADLIRKVVRSTDGSSSGRGTSGQDPSGYAKGTRSGAHRDKSKSFMGGVRSGLRGAYGADCHSHFELESRCDDQHRGSGGASSSAAAAGPHVRAESGTNAHDFAGLQGIQKTTVTEVVHTKIDEIEGLRRASQGSSQRELGPCVSVESDSS